MYLYLSGKYTKLTLLRKKIGLSIPNAVTKVEGGSFLCCTGIYTPVWMLCPGSKHKQFSEENVNAIPRLY